MSYRVQTVNDDFVSNKNKKDKATVKYPKSFSKKLSIEKVSFPVIRKWIEETLGEQLPDDDVVIDYACELLQAEDLPDIKMIYLQMQDFLGKEESMKFCETLWNLLLSAQDDSDGIPKALLEQRQKEYEAQDRTDERDTKPKTNYNRSVATYASPTDANLKKGRDRTNAKDSYDYRNNRDKYRTRTRDNRDRDPKDGRKSKEYRHDGYRSDRSRFGAQIDR